MKKMITAAFAVFALSLSLTACGEDGSDATDAETISDLETQVSALEADVETQTNRADDAELSLASYETDQSQKPQGRSILVAERKTQPDVPQPQPAVRPYHEFNLNPAG